MKKILITGANSYIGISFENYMKKWNKQYAIDTLDMVDEKWREKDFSNYDVVYHVAGIAHQKETLANKDKYYKVNRDLAIETAKKAKIDGVKQFIFLSSMSVYGMDTGVITKKTKPNPKTHYGKSKLEAENGISCLNDENFKVCILRPPMVYGPGCKGNFQLILKIVEKSPIFPLSNNERSLLYIDNLSSFVKLAIDSQVDGLFFPDNRERVKIKDIVRIAADVYEKKIYFSYLLGMCVYILRLFVPKAKKAFGSLIYMDMDCHMYSYCTIENIESLRKSVLLDCSKIKYRKEDSHE